MAHQTAREYKVILTTGETLVWLSWNAHAVRAGVFSWLCACRPANVYIKTVEAV